ncbi:transmembrane protein 205 [Centruroides vittatus]|uniref:transmembrane protein 205 n=1 Tax=Centruroides vittatus TaxID=120091 RepID=UPI00350F52A6
MMMWQKPAHHQMKMMKLTRKLDLSILFKFSQPAHILTLLIVLYLAFILLPHKPRDSWEPSPWSSFIYISTFATHFGTQIWMTFISGLVLFFNLPRTVFGQVQKQLFPKYFFLNSILGFVTFIIYVFHRPLKGNQADHKVQMWALGICFLSELMVRLYVVPIMLSVMEKRNALEKEAGVGMEVGHHDPGPLRRCPRYMKLHRTFRKLHGTCAVANIISMGCNAIHMYYLAVRLCTALT